jgi:two-component sensor histidine kinase
MRTGLGTIPGLDQQAGSSVARPRGHDPVTRDKDGMPNSAPYTIELGRGLLRALRNTGIIVFYQTSDLKVLWGQNIPQNWGGGIIVGKTDAEFLPGPAAERVSERKHAVLATGSPETLEFRDSAEDGGRWYDMWIDADTGPDGIAGIVTTVVDITERKHREQTLRRLLREVSHRSKNLLAIIQSIAAQTGRYSPDIDVFLERFNGRLQSLASSQDLVTSSNWRGAMLSKLVEGQIARFRGDADEGVVFEGVDVHFNPNAALHVGLALHELVVNSMSHGALSRADGHVRLTSEFVNGKTSGSPLLLTWSEQTGAEAVRSQKRFGSVALERVVPVSVEGTAEFNFEGDHLEYRLEVPASNFEPL